MSPFKCTILYSDLTKQEADTYCSEHRDFFDSCSGCEYYQFYMQKISNLCKSCEHLYVKDATLFCELGYEITKNSKDNIIGYGVIECFFYKWNLKGAADE